MYIRILFLLLFSSTASALDIICDYNGSQMPPGAACAAYMADNFVDTDLKKYTYDSYSYNSNLPDDYVGGLGIECSYKIKQYFSNGDFHRDNGTSSSLYCQAVDDPCPQGDVQYAILQFAGESAGQCLGSCAVVANETFGWWSPLDDPDTVFVEADWYKTGARCDGDSNSANTTDNMSERPTGENGEPCTGEYYTNSSGGTTCGSPDDGSDNNDENTNNPDSTVDNSCFTDPTSCTDTNNDGTPDTPTGCEAGQSCADSNGDGVPDTPTDSSTNSDGSANNDGNPDTEQSSDGSGKECLPSQMTYDGKCPSGTGPSSDCPSNQYELVNGVSVCKTTADGSGSSAVVSGGETCDKVPQCSGDPVGCAQLYQQWKIRCAAGVEDVKAEDFLNGNVDQQYQAMEEQIENYAENSPFGDPLTMKDFFGGTGGGCSWSFNAELLGSSFSDNGKLCEMISLFKLALSILISGYVAVTIFETFTSTIPR